MGSMFDSGESTSPQAQLSSKIHEILRHYEAPILHLQRLLVWENYFQSAIFVAVAHVCFGYVFLRSSHVLGIFFSVLLILVWVDMWKHKIWPEIRLLAPDIDSEWGELNPRLLSVKEMCDGLAQFFLNIKSFMSHLLSLRSTNPGKFCIGVNSFCLVLIFIGQKVPGALFMYLLMLCGFLTPLFFYHRIPAMLYVHLQPFIEQLHYTFQQTPGNTYQLAQSIAAEKSVKPHDDNDIEDFVPMLDEHAAAELARAGSGDAEFSEAEEDQTQDLPEVTEMINRNQNNNEPFWNSHADSDTDHSDGDGFGVPHTKPMPPTVLFQNYMVGEMANAVGSAMKESISSMAHTIQRPMQGDSDLPHAENSNASTPTSDYEFVILDREEED